MKRLFAIVVLFTCMLLLLSCNSNNFNLEPDDNDQEIKNQSNLEEYIKIENNVEKNDLANVEKISISKSDFKPVNSRTHLSLDSSYENDHIFKNSISDSTYQLIYPGDYYRIVKFEDFDLYLNVSYSFVEQSIIYDYNTFGIKLKTPEFKVIEGIRIGFSKNKVLDLLDVYEYNISDEIVILTLENYELRIQFNQSDNVESIIIKSDLYKELPEPVSIFHEDIPVGDDANYLFALFASSEDPNKYINATLFGIYTQNEWHSIFDWYAQPEVYRSLLGIESNLIPENKIVNVYDSNKLVTVAKYNRLNFTSDEAVSSNDKFSVVFESQVNSDTPNILFATSRQITTLPRDAIIKNFGDYKLYSIDINNDGTLEKFNVSSSIELGLITLESTDIANSEYNIHFKLLDESYWYDVMFADLNGDDILEIICASGPLERFFIYEYDNGNFVKRLSFSKGLN